MGAAFIIALREGIEASLIVSILLAYLRKVERSDRRPFVWGGAAAALAASAAAATVIFLLDASFEGAAAATFQGVVTLLAVVLLTGMIFWMRREGGRIRGHLHSKIDGALLTGGMALFSIAFFAVLREGVETALFLYATAKGTAVAGSGAGAQLLGAGSGLGLAVVLGAAAYRGGIRLDLRSFFRVTGIALVVVGAGLFAYGIHELEEAGVLSILGATAYDVSARLPDGSGIGAVLRGLVGYDASPSVLQVIAWAGYLLTVGAAYLFPGASRERAAVTASRPA